MLIGHSQGSLMLQMLIAREIENNPAVAARMKLAIIPGFNVIVPQGKLVGGTFKRTPLCSSPGQTGCVMAWSSFRENNVPPVGAMFGIADQPGMTVGCVNPAQPGATRVGAVRQLLVLALEPSGAGWADRLVERRAAAIAVPAHRRPDFSASASTTDSAAICRSAPTTSLARNGPTASAAKSA